MLHDVDDTAIADRLLAILRRRAGAKTDYAVRPARIPGGFDSRIFAFTLHGAPDGLSGPLVLRLNRSEVDPARARFEATVHRTVAMLGYPCPPVLLVGEADDGLGGAFLVMPRVPGRAMLDALWGPGLVRLPDLLARLHLRLHTLDPDPLRRALSTAGFDPTRMTVQRDLDTAASDVDRAQLHGLRPILDWLIVNRPPERAGQVICHGDFHPFNILVETGQPSGVIDWVNLRFADPAYDVGATTAILTHGPLDLPAGVRTAAALGRRILVAAYRRTYLRERRLERDRLRYYEALRTFGFVLEAGLVRQSAAGIIAPSSKPSAFASPQVLRAATRRLRVLTGVTPGAG